MIYFEEYDERLGRKVTHLSFHVGHGDEFIKEKKKKSANVESRL